MKSFVDSLVGQVVQSAMADAERKRQRDYVLHKWSVLDAKGMYLWNDLRDLCVKAIRSINDGIQAEFPADETKLIDIKAQTPLSFVFNGNFPRFKMTVTYDKRAFHIDLNGEMRAGSTIEGRRALLSVDLDEEGHPSVFDMGRNKLEPQDAA